MHLRVSACDQIHNEVDTFIVSVGGQIWDGCKQHGLLTDEQYQYSLRESAKLRGIAVDGTTDVSG